MQQEFPVNSSIGVHVNIYATFGDIYTDRKQNVNTLKDVAEFDRSIVVRI